MTTNANGYCYANTGLGSENGTPVSCCIRNYDKVSPTTAFSIAFMNMDLIVVISDPNVTITRLDVLVNYFK